jgi:transcription elongation factor GreA
MSKAKKITYTQQGYQQLVDELQYLRVEKREKIKNDIAVARSFGDLSENAEYDEARNEQAKNEARIKELEELLENAIIMDESNIDTGSVSLGSTVKVYDAELDMEIVYSLVGSNEADPAEGKISDQSPIGAALMDMRAGEETDIETPAGTVHIKVLEVSRTQG